MIEDTMRFLESRRGLIAAALEAVPPAPNGGGDAQGRILEFCLRGKMIRGCLVYLGAEAAGATQAAANDSLAACAAAMELFQAGLLAHDDIMDRDETRRGAPTLHALYAAASRNRGEADPAHVGEALGICLGDLCYFEAYALLARGAVGKAGAAELLALCSSVLGEVAVAQMDDVAWGASRAEPPQESILAMYRCKTARYSFSLPLAAGALLAGDPELARRLGGLGESLGILFQLRDDELGLFGSPGTTGKGLGSDLREGKKTLFRARLLEAARLPAAAVPDPELARLARLFGGGVGADAEDLAFIRRQAEELGVAASLAEIKATEEGKARSVLRGLTSLAPGTAAVLEGLVEYVTSREK